MKARFVKAISTLLTFLMLFETAQPALAYLVPDAASAAVTAEELTLRDAEGNEETVDETWEEAYPYGAFAFDVTAVDAQEGDDTVVTVYRAGGTRGKATAYIEYMPLAIPNEDGSTYLGFGLE